VRFVIEFEKHLKHQDVKPALAMAKRVQDQADYLEHVFIPLARLMNKVKYDDAEESAEIVENAYLKSKEILRDTEREVIEIINKSEIKAKADAEKEIKALEEDFNKSLENIKKAVTSKEKEAINKVIQRVIN